FCSLARPRGLPASSLFPYTTLFRSDWRGALEAEARAIETEDLAANRAMGVLGASLVVPGSGVLTHCNTGSLATAGFGTALGVICSVVAQCLNERVYDGVPRLRNTGARPTVR